MSSRFKQGKEGGGSADEGISSAALPHSCTEARLLQSQRQEESQTDTGLKILSAAGASEGACSVLNAMYAASPDGILLVTSHGAAISYNRKFAEIWGLAPEPSQGGEPGLMAASSGALLTAIADHVKAPQEFVDRLMQLFAHPDQEDHCEIELKDGRMLERHSSPLITHLGKYLGRVWFFRDISERKRFEQELLRSERRARERLAEIEQIYRCAPVGLELLDRDYRRIRINERLAAITGRTTSECIGRTLLESIPELADQIVAIGQPVLDRGETVQDKELSLNGPAGHGKIYVLVNCAPFRDESGEITGLIVAVLDITQRKLAQESIRRLDEEFKTVFNSASDAIIIVRLSDRRIMEVNATALRRYGYSREELLNMPIEEFEPDDGEAIARERQAQIIRDGECRFTCEHRRKDGSMVPVEINIRRCEFRGELAGLGIIRDISERKEVELAMIRAKEAAEDAARIKSQFLANMSHEIRTPLNGVIGMSGLILDTELTPEQRRYAEIIHDSGENLIAVVNGILDYSKLEAKKLMLEKRSFDLGSCLRQAVDIVAARAHEKGLDLTCEVSPDTPMALWGDAARLHQVLVNLVGNAVKFTLRGSVRVSVGVESADKEAAMLRFTVSDTGVGMPESEIPGLFDPFVQGDGSTTRKFGGTGLGLTIAKELVELMGGQIGAASEFGKGSTFWFTAEFARQRWGAAESEACHALKGMRVLIADSRTASRDTLRVILDSWECCSAEAADAATALELLGEAARAGIPFQAALLDVALPGMEGSAWTEQVAADPLLRATSLVAIIRLGVRSELAKSEAAGFAAHLSRPIWKSNLCEVLTAALAGEGEGRASAPSPQRTAAGRRSMHVLLVEDNPINQEVSMAMMRSLGCSADLAENGRDAVQAVEHGAYDLVLMDCEMQEMDGYVATRLIRAHEQSSGKPHLPIVAMTAHALDGDREKCLAAGMNDYLSKPVAPSRLAEILAKWQRHGREGAAAERAGAAAGSANSVFDEEQLMQRVMGDADFAAALLTGFGEQFPGKLLQFEAFVEARDFGSIRLHAHALKGAAATLAAGNLSRTADALETAAATEEVQNVLAELPRLERDFNEFTQALRQVHWAAGSRKGTEDEKSYC